MEQIHDFYMDSEKVIDIYNFAIKYWSDARPGFGVQRLYKIDLGKVALTRVAINSCASVIARTNEIINDLESSVEKEKYNQMIEEFIGMLEFFERVETSKDLTTNEKRQKLKNCLAHSNFKIIEDTEKEHEERYQVLIENDFVSVKLSIEELEKLKRFYVALSDNLDTNQKTYMRADELIELKKNNNNCLEKAVSKIVTAKKFHQLFSSLPRNMSFFCCGDDLDDEAEYLDEREQELIKNFIKYIGINNWINLNGDTKVQLFERHIKNMLANKIVFRQNGDYVMTVIAATLSDKNGKSAKTIEMFKYESPFAYVSSILDLGYFCFDYLREAHKKENLDGFDFRNFDLSGIIYKSPYEPSQKKVDEHAKIGNLLKEAENKKKKISATIVSLETNRENLKKIINMPDEKKNQLLSQNNELRKEKYEELKQVEIKIHEYTENLKNTQNYTNAANFFRHLRNSFAHGFYSVDYSKALKNSRLGDIVFHFEDFDINPQERSDRKLVFEADITAKRLVRLLNDFGTRIKNNIDVEEKRPIYYITTMSGDKIMKRRVEEMRKVLTKEKRPNCILRRG